MPVLKNAWILNQQRTSDGGEIPLVVPEPVEPPVLTPEPVEPPVPPKADTKATKAASKE